MKIRTSKQLLSIDNTLNIKMCTPILQYVLLNTKKYTVKPAHEVTSIKQSPVFKCHLFLVLS